MPADPGSERRDGSGPSDGGAAAAVVAGRPITAAAVRARVAALRQGPLRARIPADGTPAGRQFERWMAHSMVTEAVIEHEAARAGASPPIADAARALFALVTADVTVAEARVRAAYAASVDGYRAPERRRVRHILVGDRKTAAALARRIEAGADMAALAAQFSADPGTRRRGGDLGLLRRGELVGPFEDAVFSATVAEVVGPIRTEFGWHVARVEAVAGEQTIPYAQARPALRAELLSAARARAWDRWLAGRTAALARVEPDWLHPGDPRLPDPIHRH